EGHGKLSSHPMWQRQKYNVHLSSQQFRPGFRKAQRFGLGMASKTGENLSDTLSGVLPRGGHGQLHSWMLQEQTHQFLPGIPGGTYNSNFHSVLHHVSRPQLIGRQRK